MITTACRWSSLAPLVLCVAELTCSPTWASDPADRPPQRTVKTPSPTMSDVEYGKQQSQVLDFWKADADKPTPVMIYFHGGGFKKGSKKQISRDIRVDEWPSPALIKPLRHRGQNRNDLHYSAKGNQLLAKRFADKAIQLLSDNGPNTSTGGSAGPLKGSTLEGGVRVAFDNRTNTATPFRSP